MTYASGNQTISEEHLKMLTDLKAKVVPIAAQITEMEV